MKKEIFAFMVALVVFPAICFSQTIVAPTNNKVTDASGNVWGFAGSDPAYPADYYVTMNGQMVHAQGYPAGIFWSMSELLILNNGQLYATDDVYGGGDYQWNGATFIQISSLPSGGPAVVQAQFQRNTNASTQCAVSFSAIGTGDTVVGYIHSTNHDINATYPASVTDNAGHTYNLTSGVNWFPYPEDIGMWYLTNVTGNPNTFYFNFSSISECDVGLVEYSGASSVNAVVGPVANASSPDPSITISPTTTSLIWAFGAPNPISSCTLNGQQGSIETPGYTLIVDDCAIDGLGVWSSNSTVPAGSLTLTWNNETYWNASICADGTHTTTGCSTVMMAAAIN
jgi:hypothetical protein